MVWRLRLVLRSASTHSLGPALRRSRARARQLDEVGSKSLPLVALAGAATGVVLSLEMRDSLIRFGAKSLQPNPDIFPVRVVR